MVKCGRDNIGICNPLVKAPPVTPKGPVVEKAYCGNGFVIVDDIGDICKNANNGETPVCCAFAGSTELQSARIAEKSSVPFLYKGRTLFEPKEYRCQDSLTEICNGEYVRGLCSGPGNIQCCITDQIRCKHPDTKYFCRDTEHCISDGGSIKDNQCPDPDKPGQQSNYECCTIEKPYNENDKGNNAGKVSPSGKYGSCTLTGNAYSDKPARGSLELTVGD